MLKPLLPWNPPVTCLLLLLFDVFSAQAQSFSFGAKVGVPMTDAATPTSFSNGGSFTFDDRYLIGPTAEIHFPLSLSFEVDALYRHNGESAIGNISGQSSVNDWQFPFLAKYELKQRVIRPFVDAGLVYRHLSGSALYFNSYPPSSSTVLTSAPNLAGFAVGGGITLRILRIRVAPEVRYTHWFNASGTQFTVASLNANQADFLVGFTF